MKPRPLSDIPERFHAQIMNQLEGANRKAKDERCKCGCGLIIPREIETGKPVTFSPAFHILPYPPSANNYWRSIVIGGRGRVVVSREAKTFKKAVSAALQGFSPLVGPVTLTARFYRPRKRGDLDNMLKVLCDSLKGIAYEDDDQICQIEAHRFEDKERPRVEVSVCVKDS